MSDSRFLMSETECTQYDSETGEVHSCTNKKELVKVEIEPFFFTYCQQLLALYKASAFNATSKVLWKLMEIAEWNTGKIYMNQERREEIMEICSISRASFDRAIKELAELGIIKKEKTTYLINSTIFWKGDRAERQKLIKNAQLKVTFSPVFRDEDSKEKN